MPLCSNCNVEHVRRRGETCFECRTEQELNKRCDELGVPRLSEVNRRILNGESIEEAKKKKNESKQENSRSTS